MKHPKQSNQGSAIDAALAKIGASPLVGLAEEIPHIHMDNSAPCQRMIGGMSPAPVISS